MTHPPRDAHLAIPAHWPPPPEGEEYGIPALIKLKTDAACAGAPEKVYRWLYKELLSLFDFTPVKITGVATCTKLSPSTVRRALQLLEARDYLVARPVSGGGRAYRLRWTAAPDPLPDKPKRPRPAVAEAAPHDDAESD